MSTTKRVTKEDMKAYIDREYTFFIEAFVAIEDDGSVVITLFNINTPEGIFRLTDTFKVPLSKLEWSKTECSK